MQCKSQRLPKQPNQEELYWLFGSVRLILVWLMVIYSSSSSSGCRIRSTNVHNSRCWAEHILGEKVTHLKFALTQTHKIFQQNANLLCNHASTILDSLLGWPFWVFYIYICLFSLVTNQTKFCWNVVLLIISVHEAWERGSGWEYMRAIVHSPVGWFVCGPSSSIAYSV